MDDPVAELRPLLFSIAYRMLGSITEAEDVGARLELTRVNGQPGALAYDREGLLLTVLSLDVVDGRVQAIWSVANPDKLGHLGSISSYGRRDPAE
jgi:hypothetical protein